jgi:hypothetical protein
MPTSSLGLRSAKNDGYLKKMFAKTPRTFEAEAVR